MEKIYPILESPIFALLVCLLLGAVAMSGKFSQLGANFCLLGVCIVGAFGIFKSTAQQPRLAFGGLLMLVGFCLVISHWIKPPKSTERPPDSILVPPPPDSSDKLYKRILEELGEIKRTTVNKNQPEKPFLLTAGPTIASPDYQHSPFIRVTPGASDPTYLPVSLAIFVGLVNRQNVATIVQGFKAEMEVRGKGWIRLERIDTIGGEMIIVMPDGKTGVSIDKSPIFDRTINQKALQPQESALGWMFFHYPSELRELGISKRIRITVFDAAGKSETALAQKSDADNAQGAGLKWGRQIDLTPLKSSTR